MAEQSKPDLPIGYWIKKVDEVLTSCINEAQKKNGLSRTEWQILNVLFETSASRSQIIDLLRPFADARRLESTIDSLVQRGLVQVTDDEPYGKLRLTEQGRQLHVKALEVQKKIRWQAVRDISEEDYLTTIRVLQKIVANLTDESG